MTGLIIRMLFEKKKLTNKLRITNVLFNYQIKYTQLAFLLLRK